NAVDVRNLYFATGGLCETPGQVCADGSIYAGESPDGGVPMYTTPADTDFTSWNNGTGTYTDSPLVDCVADNEASCDTGEANTNTLVGLADGAEPYEAALHCANLVAHGRSDWYLPARNELMEMRTNRVAIGGFDLSGSFPNGTYWSSSEDTTFNDNDAININFQSGAENMAGNKSNELSVRCVRK
ncbi:MAG: DUF1566 domain-containing protein, partial [Alphaproteobacteria bacterium]|nr:DUF1566 domain-containing protein [Alphaproteobacteria bacterium]